MKASQKIIFNTAILYIRLIIIMILGLWSVRLILKALGEENFGIYSLVGGVVGMLAVLQSAMSGAAMRFMSHSFGSNNKLLIHKTFNTTVFLHLIIGVIVVILVEAGGYFMFNYFLNIPLAKMDDAIIVFHLMAITTFVSIIAVPYDAVINSHENLLVLSIVDMFGAILNLGIAIYLSYSTFNLLITYGLLMFFVQVVMRIIKQQYSIAHYQECKLNFKEYLDKQIMKSMLSFSGWNLFGSIAAMSVTQVISVLLNMFFGININASNGVAMQVSSKVNMVSNIFVSLHGHSNWVFFQKRR